MNNTNECTTMVLKIKGLTEDQIQEHFSELFGSLVAKYPNQFGVGLSALAKGTEEEQQVLAIADLL
ncbi:hypothetical protein [Candidatus Enterococcus ferrettii]|uniref:Uncharacterized protein n=1 Tax=Candidatus Enterococcus ferrettii TaxID=2815324 RepID=A0ABV0EVE1_9ENTE|nr:hypothetical protein [Enterococcus sp. 665A]MBO1340328.1 hypothetical protein [Enterococcus sp. 665A]